MSRKVRLVALLTLIVCTITLSIIVSSCQSKAEIEFQQYYVQGEILYNTHCSNCHQKDGTGLALLYPPLNKSDFMVNKFPEVICMIRDGKTTPIVVNGQTYEQPMPGVPSLTDIDVAKVATYIYNKWELKRGKVKVEEVRMATDSCKQN